MHFMRIWIIRLIIGTVIAWNLQAAFIFVFLPAVRGIGVLFLMWNVPYLFALKNPIRYQLELCIALLTQFIGLVGESYVLSTLSAEHVILRNSITRFIIFDGAGLLLLALAYFLSKNKSS